LAHCVFFVGRAKAELTKPPQANGVMGADPREKGGDWQTLMPVVKPTWTKAMGKKKNTGVLVEEGSYPKTREGGD